MILTVALSDPGMQETDLLSLKPGAPKATREKEVESRVSQSYR